MRGEPNAIGIRTKYKPTNEPDSFWTDAMFGRAVQMIHEDLQPVKAHLQKGGGVVIPSGGLGTGLSRLPETAPEVFEYLSAQLGLLEDLEPAFQ